MPIIAPDLRSAVLQPRQYLDRNQDPLLVMAQLAMLATEAPEEFLDLAVSTGTPPPDLPGTAAQQNVVVGSNPQTDVLAQQASVANAPAPAAAIPTGPANVLSALGSVQAPAAASPIQLQPGAPGVPPQTGGTDPAILQQIINLLSPQADRDRPTFGQLVRGATG